MSSDHHAQHDVASMSKLAGMICFFLVSLLGLLPLCMASFKTNKKLISFMSVTSAGLFLSVGLMHILPEAQEDFNIWAREHSHHNNNDQREHPFPYASLITIIGFSVVLLIDKVIPQKNHVMHLPPQEMHVLQCGKAQEDQESAQMAEQGIISTSFSNCLMFFIALALHSILECLVLGVTKKAEQAWIIFFSILSHKWMGGLSLAAVAVKNKLPQKWAVSLVVALAVCNPFAIGVGWNLSESGELVQGVLKSLSAGTFLYISVVELLIHEFSTDQHKYTKFLLLVMACSGISLLFAMMPHGH